MKKWIPWLKKWVPWLLVAAFAGWVVSTLRPPPLRGFDSRGFGSLPVLLNGRIQPMDSVARNSLLQIRNRQAVFLEDTNAPGGMAPQGTSMTAIEWLMGVMMKPEVADDQQVFRIDNQDMLSLLKLPERGKYFSYNQLSPGYDEIARQAARIDDQKIESKDQTPFEKQVMKLSNALWLYQRLKVSLRPPDSDDFEQELGQCLKDVAAVQALGTTDPDLKKPEVAELAQFLSGYEAISKYAYPLVVPPEDPVKSRDDWENIGISLTNTLRADRINPVVQHYAAMVTAYRKDEPIEFNIALNDYRQWLGRQFAPEARKGRSEFFFNEFQAFYKAMIIYVVAFLLACSFWFNWAEWTRRSAFYLVVLAWVIHTFGLVFRMVLEGRPPVTNLYSSAIFIGWGAAVLGMVLERIYRDGIGSVIASVAGFTTLVIAHNLALEGDTMEMLRAVLDTNFWLATHVTVVTLGYASTFVAGFLAIIYVVRGVFTRTLDEKTAKALARMVYGIVCFATLFSFTGTVLGGIWADQSWGRFWGWDPKENGALLIVIWNAVILHARWGGMIRERGLMNMAIFGNIITSFSWFGVNMLGIGLHSYGFMDAGFRWLYYAFMPSQAALILLSILLPRRMWRSFRNPLARRAQSLAGPDGKPAPAGA
jgi:ABC-type transport system involved in cytochrome c biogenesis permease subunit